MRGKRFRITHSLAWVVSLLVLEALFAFFVPAVGTAVILIAAVFGGVGIVAIATDIIEEVRESRWMLTFLAITIVEFLIFFAFQYHFLLHLDPASFQGLASDPVSLLLHSTMIFALNPLYLPATLAGKALLLINTLESLVLALFVLQNIWQLHRNK